MSRRLKEENSREFTTAMQNRFFFMLSGKISVLLDESLLKCRVFYFIWWAITQKLRVVGSINWTCFEKVRRKAEQLCEESTSFQYFNWEKFTRIDRKTRKFFLTGLKFTMIILTPNKLLCLYILHKFYRKSATDVNKFYHFIKL
jgi:hypothetical protein